MGFSGQSEKKANDTFSFSQAEEKGGNDSKTEGSNDPLINMPPAVARLADIDRVGREAMFYLAVFEEVDDRSIFIIAQKVNITVIVNIINSRDITCLRIAIDGPAW